MLGWGRGVRRGVSSDADCLFRFGGLHTIASQRENRWGGVCGLVRRGHYDFPPRGWRTDCEDSPSGLGCSPWPSSGASSSAGSVPGGHVGGGLRRPSSHRDLGGCHGREGSSHGPGGGSNSLQGCDRTLAPTGRSCIRCHILRLEQCTAHRSHPPGRASSCSRYPDQRSPLPFSLTPPCLVDAETQIRKLDTHVPKVQARVGTLPTIPTAHPMQTRP